MRRYAWRGIALLLILLPMVAWAGVTTVDGGSPITSTVVFDRLHQLMTGAAYSATIVSDEVPGTTDDGSCAGRYEVTAEAGGVDDLASMDASGCQDGDLVILWAASGQTLTVKGDSTGNITLLNGQDFTLDTQTKFVLLQRNGTEFYGVGFHAGSAGLKAGDLVQYVLDDGVKPGGSQGIANIKATTYTIGTDDTRECYGGIIQVTTTATINACPATVGVRFAVKAQGAGVTVTLEADNSGTPDTFRVNGVVPTDTDTIVAAGVPGDIIACWYYAADTLDCTSAAGRTLTHISFPMDPTWAYAQNATYHTIPLITVGDYFPDGFTLHEWSVEYVEGDPTTELDADIVCDSTPDYNPAAGATVMDVVDTTTGSSGATGSFDSDTCANGDIMYVRFGADPTDSNVMIHLEIWGY